MGTPLVLKSESWLDAHRENVFLNIDIIINGNNVGMLEFSSDRNFSLKTSQLDIFIELIKVCIS
jgi:hypothetical protein